MFECCSGYCDPTNYVAIGPDLDICQHCAENIDEWSEPVNLNADYYDYMIDNDNFQWSYETAEAA